MKRIGSLLFAVSLICITTAGFASGVIAKESKKEQVMKAVEFEGQNVVFAENQPEYESLPAFVSKDVKGIPATFCFELDEDELNQVKNTGKIFITILTFGHPLQPIHGSLIDPMRIHKESKESALKEAEKEIGNVEKLE